MLKICSTPTKPNLINNQAANRNKIPKVWRLTLGLAMAVMLSAHTVAASPVVNGVMHLITETDFFNTGVDTNAQGKINVTMTRQGNANNQDLHISATKLDPNTTYGLFALVGSNTNELGVAELTTDRKGSLNVTYEKKSQGRSNPHKQPLPVVLDPLCGIRELSIVNQNQAIVLRGIMTNPSEGSYMVNRSLDNVGYPPKAKGNLIIHAGARSTLFSMQASGLTPLTVYNLAINGVIVQAHASDRGGRLFLRELPTWAPDVLNINSLALTDVSGNHAVLTAGGLGIPCDAAATGPTVTSTGPVNLATNAPINDQITATFGESMNPATLTGTTFTLQQNSTSVTGTVSYTNGTATFSPASSLRTNTLYTATITTGAQNLSGAALASSYIWSFITSASSDNTLPAVSLTSPANTATNVAINCQLAATFSKAMNPATLTSSTFTLAQGSLSVTGMVSFVSGTAIFAPATNLLTNTTYSASLTTGVMDLDGNALATNFVWSFTTGSSTDTNPPTVLVVAPMDMSTNVALNQTVSATFSKFMDPSTITTNSFTLTGPGSNNVTGTVAYAAAGQIASFTPATDLAPDTTYTNTITTSTTDLAGNTLATDAVWTFTTGTAEETNLMSIPLGAASSFAILATAAISGGANQINGDVGLAPGSAQGIAPSEINGTIHVNDPAAIAAQASLLAAYNKAVNRSVNAQNLEGNLGGLTKTPGLYVNSSSTGITGSGANAILTLDAQGDANAVFVFKMASTLITTAGTSIVLAGGAQAKNIYWQVGSSATLGTTTIFKGNILAFVTITVNSGSTVDGRLFAGSGGNASGAVTVQSSTVTVPAP